LILQLKISNKNSFPYYIAIFIIFPIFGIIQDWIRYFTDIKPGESVENPELKDFVPLYKQTETFFTRNVYFRVRDGLNIPINSCPSDRVNLLQRRTIDPNGNWHIKYNHFGSSPKMLNLASYNYLGFAQTEGTCAESAIRATKLMSYWKVFVNLGNWNLNNQV